MMSWTPNRKIWTGSLAGVVAGLLTNHLGLDPQVATGITVAAMAGIGYLIPEPSRPAAPLAGRVAR